MDRIYSPAENTSTQLIKEKRFKFAATGGADGCLH